VFIAVRDLRNLQIYRVLTFECANRGRVCVRVFIGVRVVSVSVVLCDFLKKTTHWPSIFLAGIGPNTA
jgi:hypothetical protein